MAENQGLRIGRIEHIETDPVVVGKFWETDIEEVLLQRGERGEGQGKLMDIDEKSSYIF